MSNTKIINNSGKEPFLIKLLYKENEQQKLDTFKVSFSKLIEITQTAFNITSQHAFVLYRV